MPQWRDIPGHKGRYQVSDDGQVRSLNFRSSTGRTALMRASRNYAGYRVVTLGPQRKQYRVHVLVLLAFVGPRPTGMQACHRNGDKDDNRLVNLRWDTPVGNIADRRPYHGEQNPNAKLTTEQWREITRRRRAGEKAAVLAREYGVAPTRISQIVRTSPQEVAA